MTATTTTTTTTTTKRPMTAQQSRVRNELHDTARVLANLELPENCFPTAAAGSISFFTNSKEELRELRRAVGKVEKMKSYNGYYLRARIEDVRIAIYPPSGLCRQVETDEVEEYSEPVKFVTKTRPKMKWECDPVLED